MTSYADSFFARLLRRLAAAIWRRPNWFIYPQVALSILCLFYTERNLQFDMNRDNLVGSSLKTQRIYLAYEKEFPGVNDMAIVVESGSVDRNRWFVERLAEQIEPETNLFRGLLYKTDVTTLGPKSLLFFPTNDLTGLRKSLGDYLPLIRQFAPATNFNSLFNRVNEQFASAAFGSASNAESMINGLPFLQGIVTEAARSMASPVTPPPPDFAAFFGGGAQAELSSYITFGNGRYFILSVLPRTDALVPEAIVRLRQIIHATELTVPGVDVGLTGGPVLDYDEMKQSENDTLKASIVALILCSMIFIVSYRQVGRPLKAAACLVMGMAYTLGFTTLAIGRLNILTITFAPMLIGLAIDFGIHLITRFEEEMRNRREPREALERAMSLTGQGIVTGALTTAAAFGAMALTRFIGVQEMGIIAGAGLLLCLAPMMTALPALLLIGRENLLDREIGPAGQARLIIGKAWLRHSGLIVGGSLALCAAAAFGISRIHFDYNLLDVQSQHLKSVIYEKKMLQSAGRSSLFAAVIADSAKQARDYEVKIKRLSLVSDVQSVADYLDGDQTKKLELARSIKKELAGLAFPPIDRNPVNVNQLDPTLWYLSGYLGLGAEEARASDPNVARQLQSMRSAIDELRMEMAAGANPEAVARLAKYQQVFLAGFHRIFTDLETQDTSGPLRPRDLPAALRDRFIGVNGKYLLEVYSKIDLWRHDNQLRFTDELRSAAPSDRVTGVPVQVYVYTTVLKDSYEQAALYSLAAIMLVIVLHFRSFLSIILSLLPVVAGSLWLLGFMGVFGLPFNPANIMTLPLIVGIGVTNGIQILNRFAEEREPNILAKSTGKAVLVSGLTALSGFGSLMLAQNQGIRSLGEMMAVGIAACMVAALAFLPSLLRAIVGHHWAIFKFAPNPDPIAPCEQIH